MYQIGLTDMMQAGHHELPVAVSNRTASGPKTSLRPDADLDSETDLDMYYDLSLTQGDDSRPLRTGHLLRTWTPLREVPPRRKVVWIWTCVGERSGLIHSPSYETHTFVPIELTSTCQCICGQGGMKINVDPCFSCGFDRCPNCETRRVNSRPC